MGVFQGHKYKKESQINDRLLTASDGIRGKNSNTAHHTHQSVPIVIQ